LATLRSESTQQQQHNANQDDFFTLEELHHILSSLPSGKTPGADGIPFELLKVTKHAFASILLDILNYFWKHELSPPQWDTSVIHMLYKKGDPLVPENC
jgi:hypothetical protein